MIFIAFSRPFHCLTLCIHCLLTALSLPFTAVSAAGDLLFVPAGTPHAVRNLELSLAVSANYIDQVLHSEAVYRHCRCL